MKAKKILSMIIAAAMAIQCAAISAVASEPADGVTVVASDSTTDWKMVWDWARNQEGFEFVSSQISTENGLKLVVDTQKLNEFATYRYPSKDEGVTKCEASGEYKYYMKLDESGNPVAYDSNVANARPVMVYHQNRDNYFAEFNVGETQNNGKSIILSYDFDTSTQDNANWSSPRMSVMGFTLRHNVNNKYQIAHNGGEIYIEKDSTRQKHSVKVVIAPTVTGGRYEMTAIMVDDVITPLSGVYSTTSGKTDADCYLSKLDFTLRLAADRYAEITNLKVARGFDDIVVSTDFVDGDEPCNGIKLSFSDAVQLAEGAVKVYENGTAMSSDSYTVAMADDNKTATITIPQYKNRTAYKITVEKALVSGLLGGEMEEDFEVNFVTSKKLTILEGSENLASGYTVEPYGYGPLGQSFTTVTTDEDGVTTITVDNATWAKAETENADKIGDTAWTYGKDEEGNAIKIGNGTWKFAQVNIKNFADEKNSTDPIVISMDYAYENMQSSGDNNDMWIKTGDTATQMYLISAFGPTPAVSGATWGGKVYANNVTETDWHSVQYVIDPTIDENKKTHMTQITLDGEVIKDTAQNWISYTAANDADEYVNSIEMRIKRQTATDENGNVLPTVLKMKNFKIVRAKEFNVAVDSVALTNKENTLSLRFSDPVTEGELANLKVMKGTETVENPISAISLASDGLSAKVTMALDATARYTLVTSEVADIYGVKSSTAPVEFEYYNIADGYVTFADTAVTDDGTNTTVSFTLTASKTAAPDVIVAAYDDECNLIGVGMASVDVTSKTDASDSITLEKVTGADKIQIMAWDSIENMKPYCLAKTID